MMKLKIFKNLTSLYLIILTKIGKMLYKHLLSIQVSVQILMTQTMNIIIRIFTFNLAKFV